VRPLSAALVCAVALGCATSGPRARPRGLDPAAAGTVLLRFARAVEEGRFPEAHPLLSARWRSAYTPGRLGTDYAGAGPVAAEAAGRVIAALASGQAPVRDGGRALLTLAGGRIAVLVAEEGAWRVDALE